VLLVSVFKRGSNVPCRIPFTFCSQSIITELFVHMFWVTIIRLRYSYFGLNLAVLELAWTRLFLYIFWFEFRYVEIDQRHAFPLLSSTTGCQDVYALILTVAFGESASSPSPLVKRNYKNKTSFLLLCLLAISLIFQTLSSTMNSIENLRQTK